MYICDAAVQQQCILYGASVHVNVAWKHKFSVQYVVMYGMQDNLEYSPEHHIVVGVGHTFVLDDIRIQWHSDSVVFVLPSHIYLA